MKFSIFTPLGHFKFSRLPPLGQRIFNQGAAALGDGRPGAYRIERADGQRTFAWLYAWAMTLASAQILQERAAAQWDPAGVTDMLAVQEAERGSIPQAGWTIGQRREQLQRMRRLIQDVSRNGIKTALEALLPGVFLAYVPTPVADVVNWPTGLGDQPMLLAPATLPRRVATLTSPVTSTGTALFVNYEQRAEGIEWQLQRGDRVVIEPENNERAEMVTLADAFDSDGGPPYFLRLSCQHPHAAGVSILRAPWPMWTGSKRHSLVVLTAEMALDPESRRLVNWLMERMARATSTWDIAADNGDGLTAGPFKVEEGMIGVTPIGEVTL